MLTNCKLENFLLNLKTGEMFNFLSNDKKQNSRNLKKNDIFDYGMLWYLNLSIGFFYYYLFIFRLALMSTPLKNPLCTLK